MTIRHFTLADIAAIVPVFMRGFRHQANHQRLLEWLLQLQPDGFWTMEVDGKLAGMVGAVRYDEAAYLNMMVVEPELQGRGIGKALLETLLADLARHGCKTVMLEATPAGKPLYEHFGFAVDGGTHDLRRLGERECAVVGAAGLPDDFDEIVAWDAAAFGAERRRMLESMLGLPNSRAITAAGGMIIANEFVVGPWVAGDADTAEVLLNLALGLRTTKAGRLMVPAENEAALGMLLGRGYEIGQTAPHMRRGPALKGRNRGLTFGQASLALG